MMALSWLKFCVATAVVAMLVTPAQSSSITVLNQNVQLFIVFGESSDQRMSRARQYGDRVAALGVSAPDVIGFSETFLLDASEELWSKLKASHPHQVTNIPNKIPSGKFINSGLSLVSKYPILKWKFREYSKCSGADCLSAKGGLVAVIQLPRSFAVVSVCHKNAGGTDEVMTSQVVELNELLTEFVATSIPAAALNFTALISMGDFNIAADTDLYSTLIETLSDETVDPHKTLNPGTPGLTFPVSTPERRIDYIFDLRSIGGGSCSFPSVAAVAYTVDTLVAPSNGSVALSDHYGVRATFSIGEMPGVNALPALINADTNMNASCNPSFFENSGGSPAAGTDFLVLACVVGASVVARMR